jgi:hypothetical protein
MYSFYCILLLSALFLSSCHWSPVPLDTTLSRPATNASTFRDVLELSNFTDSQQYPSTIRLLDRCWCDGAASRLFEPFDILKWELASIRRTAADLNTAQNLTEKASENATASTEPHVRSNRIERARINAENGFVSLFASFARKSQRTTDELSSGTPIDPSVSATLASSPSPHPLPTHLPPYTPSTNPSPWELDLRAYGFPVVLDFSWSRTFSSSN